MYFSEENKKILKKHGLEIRTVMKDIPLAEYRRGEFSDDKMKVSSGSDQHIPIALDILVSIGSDQNKTMTSQEKLVFWYIAV